MPQVPPLVPPPMLSELVFNGFYTPGSLLTVLLQGTCRATIEDSYKVFITLIQVQMQIAVAGLDNGVMP